MCLIKDTVDAGPTDLQPLRNLRRTKTLGSQGTRLCSLGSGCRCSAPILALCLRLGDALALALQHHLALELADSPDHCQQQLSCRGAGVHAEIEDLEMSTLALHPINDLQQVLRRARQPVELADHQHVAFADVL